MQIKKIIVSLAVLAVLPSAAAGKHHTPRKVATTKTPADYVNPFVGTDGFGNVYPGAQLPFGGIQISPDTDEHYYDCASGYKWNRASIQGFSLTHLSGTGIPDLGDFLFMPVRVRRSSLPVRTRRLTAAIAHDSLTTTRRHSPVIMPYG